jgi:hypothetical protein
VDDIMTELHIWNPISTAPKDGTLMFLDYGDGELYVGQWARFGWVPQFVVENGALEPFLGAAGEPIRYMDFPTAPLPYDKEENAA